MNKSLFFLFFFYSFFSQASSGGIYKVIFPKKNTLVSAVYNGDINKEKALIKKEIIVNKKTGERIDVSNMGLVELSKIEGMAFIDPGSILITFPRINTLHSAVYKGDIKKVKALIKKGVNVNNKIGERIVEEHYVDRGLKKETLDKLKKIPTKQWTYKKRGTTPLHWIRNDNVEIAKLLIDNGADVNAKTKKFFKTKFGKFTSSPTISILAQSTPLHIAILNKHIKTAKLLIENGADVNAKYSYGYTPLHIINNIDIIKLLIDKGADVNAKDDYRNTPLHYAKDLEIVKLLIDNGADVNAINNKGKSLCDKPISLQKRIYIKKKRGCFPLIIIPKKIWHNIKSLF